MSPNFILAMRHAEKPDDVENPHLSAAGQERAMRLAEYVPQKFGSINFLFASAITRHSARPYETITPLSQKIGVSIDDTIADNEYGTLASELLSKNGYSEANVLVCWHHERIHSLMHALGAPHGSYPDPWDPDVFNLIIKLGLKENAPTVELIDEPF